MYKWERDIKDRALALDTLIAEHERAGVENSDVSQARIQLSGLESIIELIDRREELQTMVEKQ